MRALLMVPVGVMVVAACGVAVCGALGASVQARELIAASITCLIGGELAMIPLLLTRGGTHGPVAVASLFGTLIHLMICLIGAAIVVMGKIGLGQSYVFWLFPLYLSTLVVLVILFARALRAAPMAQANKV